MRKGVDIELTLLPGKVFEKVLQHARKTQPWMLILGRIGIHSQRDEMDLGSNTENLLRLAPCHVLLSSSVYVAAAGSAGRRKAWCGRMRPRRAWSACRRW